MSTVNNRIENVYGLTPLQEGMLFHYLYEKNTTAYILQSVFTVNEEVELGAVEKALKLLSRRFDVLRTAFAYEKIKKPRQVVIADREAELKYLDFSDKDTNEFEKDFQALLSDDQKKGFDLTRDPLLRLNVIKKDETTYKFVFTTHHIIVDGWCVQIIITKFFEYLKRLTNREEYEAISKEIEKECSESAEYGEYVEWINEQDQAKAIKYWSEELADYDNDAVIKAMKKPCCTDKTALREKLQKK